MAHIFMMIKQKLEKQKKNNKIVPDFMDTLYINGAKNKKNKSDFKFQSLNGN